MLSTLLDSWTSGTNKAVRLQLSRQRATLDLLVVVLRHHPMPGIGDERDIPKLIKQDLACAWLYQLTLHRLAGQKYPPSQKTYQPSST